jgi:hypothetical protein
MSFIALTVWLAAFCVQVGGGGRLAPSLVRPSRPAAGRPSLSGKLAAHHGPSAQRAVQAQAADNETGRDGQGGTDLAPTRTVSMAAPGRPECPAAYAGPGPAFQAGRAVNGGRPRPPPERPV